MTGEARRGLWGGVSGGCTNPALICDGSLLQILRSATTGPVRQGIATITPHATLDVNGEVRVGNTSLACSGTTVGAQHYNATSNLMEFCNGTVWTPMNVFNRYALTDGATIATDWSNGTVQSVTLGGNRTFTFANGVDGGRYILILKQDATGTRTVTWPGTVRWPGGTAPTLTTTASKTDYIGFLYNGVSSTYDGVALAQNF